MKAFKQFYGWFVIFSVVIYLAYLVAVLAHLPSDMFHFCSFIVAAFMAVLLSATSCQRSSGFLGRMCCQLFSSCVFMKYCMSPNKPAAANPGWRIRFCRERLWFSIVFLSGVAEPER